MGAPLVRVALSSATGCNRADGDNSRSALRVAASTWDEVTCTCASLVLGISGHQYEMVPDSPQSHLVHAHVARPPIAVVRTGEEHSGQALGNGIGRRLLRSDALLCCEGRIVR